MILLIYPIQITTYTKFNAPENLERENNYARAVCASELQKRYYSNKEGMIVYTLICLSIFFPFFVIILCLFTFKKASEVVHSLSKPSKHETTVAMSLIGVYVSFSIYIMDIIACHSAVTANHEYRDDIDDSSLNVMLTVGTLVCDTIFLVPLIFGLFHAFCISGMEMCGKEHKCNRILSKYNRVIKILSKVTNKEEDTSRDNDDDNNNMVIFLCMLVSPLLCISSHVGFILMAWLTEPTKSTTVFILYYFVFVYLFLIFRECYRFYSDLHFSWTCKKKYNTIEYPGCIQLEELSKDQDASSGITDSATKSPRKEQSKDQGDSRVSLIKKREQNDMVNVQAFCLILLVHSIFIVGIPIMIALAFILVPLETAGLVTYIFQLFQLLVVLISTIFIYQLFSTQKFNIDKFLKVFRKKYEENENDSAAESTDSADKKDERENK